MKHLDHMFLNNANTRHTKTKSKTLNIVQAQALTVPESGGFNDAAVPPVWQQTEQFVARVMGVFYNHNGDHGE